jgi:hypothetical protein
VAEYREATFDEVPTHNSLGSLPLLLSEDSSDGSRHASMDHASSHHSGSPLLDDSYHVLLDPSPSQYDVGPLPTSTSTLPSTPSTVSRQTPVAC